MSGEEVLVHDPNVLPDVSEMGFLVSPGMEAHVAVKKTVLKRLPEPYAKPPNLCEDSHQTGYRNPLQFFSEYSLSACRRECRINHELSECGCSSHINGGENVTICSFKDFLKCALPARGLYDADPSMQVACDCLPECEESVFDVSVSSAVMPHDLMRERLVRAINVPQVNITNIDKNIISLKIFFGEMRYTHIEQEPRYTTTSLFGELGGQMGLCLGASVLTLAELLQLVAGLCMLLCKRTALKKSTAVQVLSV